MPKLIDHAERRLELARCAVAAIDELGLDAVRLVDIARMAGCTTGAVSHYFSGKEALLEAALDHVLGSLSGHLNAAAPASSAEVIDGLARLLPLDATRQRDWRVWIAFCGRAVSTPALARAHQGWYEHLEAQLAERLAALSGKPMDAARDLATRCIAAVDGIGLRATLEAWPAERQQRQLRAQLAALLPADGKQTAARRG